jgi:hypothetical protein
MLAMSIALRAATRVRTAAIITANKYDRVDGDVKFMTRHTGNDREP